MARKPRKIELYEVLSHRRSEAGLTESPYPVDDGGPVERKLVTPERTGREIVLSLDVAFVIFVVVLALLGTAFILGVQRGEAEASARFNNQRDGAAVARSDLGVAERVGQPESRTVVPEAGKWTLRLRLTKRHDSAALNKLRLERRDLLQEEVVRAAGVDVFILDNGPRSVYSLSMGVFPTAQDEALRKLKEHFAVYRGIDDRVRYPDVSAEQFRDLGDVVE